jgi:hypothetical protein
MLQEFIGQGGQAHRSTTELLDAVDKGLMEQLVKFQIHLKDIMGLDFEKIPESVLEVTEYGS